MRAIKRSKPRPIPNTKSAHGSLLGQEDLESLVHGKTGRFRTGLHIDLHHKPDFRPNPDIVAVPFMTEDSDVPWGDADVKISGLPHQRLPLQFRVDLAASDLLMRSVR